MFLALGRSTNSCILAQCLQALFIQIRNERWQHQLDQSIFPQHFFGASRDSRDDLRHEIKPFALQLATSGSRALASALLRLHIAGKYAHFFPHRQDSAVPYVGCLQGCEVATGRPDAVVTIFRINRRDNPSSF